jgi:hypothetical protein
MARTANIYARVKPISYQSLSADEFNAIIEKGIKDYADGKTISAESFAEQMHKEFADF